MTKRIIILICTLLVMQLAACSSKTVTIEGFSAPESVISDGTYFYVSNVGEELKPMDKDGDGYISRLSAEGRVLDRKFINGLNAPKGMAVLGGILYVADIDHFKGFALSDRKMVLDLDFSAEGTSFLNGITVTGSNDLLVSAMDKDELYQVQVGENPSFSKVIVEGELYGPNGLCFDPETGILYIASFGKDHKPNGIVGKGKIKNGKLIYKKIYSQNGLYDGIVVSNGKVIVSDWVEFKKSGQLIQIDPETGEAAIIKLAEKIGGPADFYLDKKEKRLWIPMMMENKVMITRY